MIKKKKIYYEYKSNYPEMSDNRAGKLAEEILSNPIMHKAFEDLKLSTAKKWALTDIEDTDKREFLYFFNLAIEELKRTLELYVNNAIISMEDKK